ncbi:serine/threonine protein kinase [Streptosporangium amethystogenes subsp. fukuiense]|uniref:non-specific serine/threonine protein kinase n=1 Tax=Streptosporangium amethystogenes subsp. fukuiense TaxID=698418 RepID=A0ABW2T995_9ACTN
MPDLASLRPGDPEKVREYRLTARLGEGGQGTVYLGVAPTGAEVAVKLLRRDLAQNREALERFVREVDTARRVAPFCTAAVIETGVDEQRPYIVSEYVKGPTLDHVVGAEGPREGASLHRLAIGTVTALVAIHQAEIVHRDFKPANVLLAADGPRVIDFGIAKALDRTSSLTSTAIGTPAYMTPEQLAGRAAGPAADMFAWAGTMVFAATGQPPFGADSLPAIFNRILNAEPDLSAIADPTLRELVGRCLTKDESLRPTAGEALMCLLGHTGPGTQDIQDGRGAQGGQGASPLVSPRGMLAEGVAAAAQRTDPAYPPYPGGPQSGASYRTDPGSPPPHQTGPGGYATHWATPGGYSHQVDPGGYPPHQAGPGGYPSYQTGPNGYAVQQTEPGRHPHRAGPGGYPPPHGFAPQGAVAPAGHGAQQFPGRKRRVRRGWIVACAGLALTLVAVTVTVLVQNGTLTGTGTGTRVATGSTTTPTATASPRAVSAVPPADRKIKLPGSSITIHESDKDPIKLTSYFMWRGNVRYTYTRRAGTDEFVREQSYYYYRLNPSGTHALAVNSQYSVDGYEVASIVDHKSGAKNEVKIAKKPIVALYPLWSPDGTKGLVTLYETIKDDTRVYGYATIDIATKKASVVRVKEVSGSWSYFWRSDSQAVGAWTVRDNVESIRFYDLQGTVLQNLSDVDGSIWVEGDPINPSGTLMITYCGVTQEICLHSTGPGAELKARIPFATERILGWYDDRHVVAWRRQSFGYEALVVDFKGKVKRVLAASTDDKEYKDQSLSYTMAGG